MIEVKHLKTLQALRKCGSLQPLRRRCIRRNPPCLTSLAIWNNALASGYLCVRASRYALHRREKSCCNGKPGTAAN